MYRNFIQILDKYYYYCLALVFLPFPVNTSFDSAWYHKYSSIIEGSLPWTQWDYVRGITYPLFLALSHWLFGYSGLGLILSLCICFLLSAYFFESVLIKLGLSLHAARLSFLCTCVLNASYFGYSHTLLTESLFFVLSLAFVRFLLLESIGFWKFCIISALFLYGFYQLKENYFLLVIPLLILRSSSEKMRIRVSKIILILFLVFIANTATRATLGHLTGDQTSISVGRSFLISALTFGGLKGEFSSDIPLNTEFIHDPLIVKDGNNNGCWIKNKQGIEYHFSTRKGLVICPVPAGIKDALKERAYLTYLAGFSVIPDYAHLFAETIGVVQNRYNENSHIGLQSIRMANKHAVVEILEPPEYQAYVAPYKVEVKEFPFLFGILFGWLSPIAASITSFVFTGSVVIGCFQCIKKYRSSPILWLSASITTYFFACIFLGAFADRYVFSAYPVGALVVSLAFHKLMTKLKNKSLLRFKLPANL